MTAIFLYNYISFRYLFLSFSAPFSLLRRHCPQRAEGISDLKEVEK